MSPRTKLALAVFIVMAASFPFPRAGAWQDQQQADAIVALLELVVDADAQSARKCLQVLREKVQNHELIGEQLAQLEPRLESLLKGPLENAAHPLHIDAALLLASWENKQALDVVAELARTGKPDQQETALIALIAAGDPRGMELARQWLDDPEHPELQLTVLTAIGQREHSDVAELVLSSYSKLSAELQPKAIELLTQRASWAHALLDRIDAEQIQASVLNVNQIAALQVMGEPSLEERVRQRWGVVRQERNPKREQVIADVRKLLDQQKGDPHLGWAVFRRVCGQCHKIHGEGQDVAPDLTRNGRGSLEQVLSNMLDPSLVIGASYQARVVVTTDGRVLTGLMAEENDQRIVLKMQGGKTEVVPADEIEEIHISPLSLMPEGLEEQLQTQELIDLIAFLRLDKPPTDPSAVFIPDVAPLEEAK